MLNQINCSTPCVLGILMAVTIVATSLGAVEGRPASKWPDPLVRSNGVAVTTKKLWVNSRRPELKEQFQQYMYGMMPPAPAKIVSSVEREDKAAFGGKATLK